MTSEPQHTPTREAIIEVLSLMRESLYCEGCQGNHILCKDHRALLAKIEGSKP